LAAIRGYIAEFSPLAAQRFALKLITAAEDRVEEEEVLILRIRHAARRPD
jgi:plasmid stabilization system protein ParE